MLKNMFIFLTGRKHKRVTHVSAPTGWHLRTAACYISEYFLQTSTITGAIGELKATQTDFLFHVETKAHESKAFRYRFINLYQIVTIAAV
jgi:hypothetical protein